MRIRTVKPEFYQHEDLSALPVETHLFAAGLLNCADDEGYFNANPGLLKAAIFPLRETSVTVHDMLAQLAGIGYIRLGNTTDGKHYGHVVNFTIHQRVNRPTPSKIKALPTTWESSLSTHGTLTEDSSPERKGREGNGREEALSSNANASDDSQLLPHLQVVWTDYLEKTGRNPKTYDFTSTRKRKGLARLRECLRKTGGDIGKAVELMKLATANLVASDFHMGRDAKTGGKRYCEWENHLFKSYEQMEKWWNE